MRSSVASLCAARAVAGVFFAAAYRNRREFNWLVGMALLATTLGLSFTGYLLPWDQLAFAMVKRSLEHFIEDRRTGVFVPRFGDIRPPNR